MLFTAVIGKGSIVTRPANTAARVGSRAIFNCTVNISVSDCELVMWLYDKPGSVTDVLIYTSTDDNDVRPDYGTKFDIERNGQHGVYNLVIKNVSMDLAVGYACWLTHVSTKAVAHLVAISMTHSFTYVNNCL